MRLLKSEKLISPNEVNQSVVRSVNTLLILLYVSNYAHNLSGEVITPYTIYAFLYLLATIPLYIWSLRCVKLADTSKERHFFRVIGISGDILILSIVIALSDKGGIPLLFMYLWIIVANGIRYGMFYLLFAVLLSISCFSTLILELPAWQAEQLFPIAIGLLISMVILPVYILNLISKLTLALEAEKNANNIKNNFLAIMNHELRTPLSSIVYLTEIICTYKLPTKIYRLMDMIKSSANTQLQIVNGILDISRVEAGEYSFLNSEFNLYKLIHETKNIIFPHVQKKGIDLYIYIDSRCNRSVIGPYDQLKQILVNLIGNAVKFTDAGYVRLSVDLGEVIDQKQELLFHVQDTGIGIDNNRIREIFMPYKQADPTITRIYGGTGLGITISDELARMMDGKISVESTLKKGSTFTFRIFLDTNSTLDELPNDLRLIPVKFSESNSVMLEKIACLGVKILNNDLEYANELFGEIKHARIAYILDEDGFASLSETSRNNILRNDTPIIHLTKNVHNANALINVLTSITPESDTKVLKNALNICNEFMPAANNRHIKTNLNIENNLNILLAEDDHTLRELQKIVFENAGFRISVAKHGQEALMMLMSEKYDLAVLDLYMPTLSGVDVVKSFKKDSLDAGPRFILLTAEVTDDYLTEGSSKLFDSILIKPTTPTLLLSEVNRLLEIDPRAETENSKVSNSSVLHISKRSNTTMQFPECYLNPKVIDENLASMGYHALKEILVMYDIEVVNNLLELSHAFEQELYEKSKTIIHNLKGSSSSVGTTVFTEMLEYVLSNISEANKLKLLKLLIQELTNVHKLSIFAFDIYINNKSN